MSKEEKMLSAFSHILYIKEGIRISPQHLKSVRKENILDPTIIKVIEKYSEYFKKIEEIVEFIDDVKNPTGIYNIMRDYAQSNGTQYTKSVEFVNNKTKKTFKQDVDDYYEPNDPEEYVFVIIDHISLIQKEKEGGKLLSLHESITKLSANYLVRLRNKYNYIPVVIQQQAAAQESVENMRANRLKPTLDGLGDCKLTGRDANVVFGLFDPYRHELPSYKGYDIKKFQDRIRFMEILAYRGGRANVIAPLYFDGATNEFKELPKPNDTAEMEKVYKFLKK